ncbi:hypothetical protein CPB83DRAFT_844150 [Crepidotus variabilis]|uniref:Uncharacterized protein n=1 Tax=Crepidotus variabilis TaxID=179855 RepID=A0A9P6ESD5_9AGAR|nr:hypothetical protein CPB83DRAFT_844150 [Crepidotus variabilis]
MPPMPGEPRESPKPQPIGDMSILFLSMTCTLCALFLLWRRATSLRKVVSHQLKSLTRTEGRIRLSEDDGPQANEFLADDFDDDNEHLHDSDDEPLSQHIHQATRAWREPTIPQSLTADSNTTVKTLAPKPSA